MSSKEKITLFQLGALAVGKTAIAERFFYNSFNQVYLTTIGLQNYNKEIKIDDLLITIRMQDTAGQERFHSISKTSVRGCNGLIFTFDMTKRDSFDMISKLINNTNDVINLSEIPLVLIGNKIDQENSINITKNDVDELLQKFDKYQITFFQTSAKTGVNVKEAFLKLIETILENRDIDYEKEQLKEAILGNTGTPTPTAEEEEDGVIGTRVTRKKSLTQKEKSSCCF